MSACAYTCVHVLDFTLSDDYVGKDLVEALVSCHCRKVTQQHHCEGVCSQNNLGRSNIFYLSIHILLKPPCQ